MGPLPSTTENQTQSLQPFIWRGENACLATIPTHKSRYCLSQAPQCFRESEHLYIYMGSRAAWRPGASFRFKQGGVWEFRIILPLESQLLKSTPNTKPKIGPNNFSLFQKGQANAVWRGIGKEFLLQSFYLSNPILVYKLQIEYYYLNPAWLISFKSPLPSFSISLSYHHIQHPYLYIHMNDKIA